MHLISNELKKHLGWVPVTYHRDTKVTTPVRFGEINPPDRFGRTVQPLDREVRNFVRWANEKARQVGQSNPSEPTKDDWRIFIPTPNKAQIKQPGSVRLAENLATLELYKKTFDSFMWTGIECSNPENRHGQRWDLLEMGGIYDPQLRRKQIAMLNKLGIQNVRLGVPTHKIAEEKSWRTFSNVLRDFKQAGAKISLDFQHFGMPSRFRNNQKPEESIFLNPKWPQHFVRNAMSLVKRHFNDIDAITLINEPLITNKFSGTHWNEAYPGNEKHPGFNRQFIQRAMLMAKAATKARFEIEKHIQRQPDPEKARKVFVHNESCEYQPDNPEFNEYQRFLTSDLILGNDWLLKDDYQQTPIFQWMEKQYVRDEKDRKKLVTELDTIRKTHLDFQKAFGKTMKADTIFGIDYYDTCENGSGLPAGKPWLYAPSVEAGKRRGLYGITVDYWNRYKLPMLHTETNMANKLSAKWGTQQLLELAQLAKTDIPVLGFTWYSLMDQYGWEAALSGSPETAQRNHIGLVSPRDWDLRSFAKEVLPELLQTLRQP